MAYPSVISLKLKIEDLLYSSDTCFVPSCREMLELAHKQVESLEQIAERMSWTSMSCFVLEIAGAAQKFEEAIESLVSKPPKESCGDQIQFDEHHLEREIHSLADKMKKMEEEYADELYDNSSLEEEEEEEDDGEQMSKVVGLSDRCNDVKRKLVQGTGFEIFSLVGMPGIGKTTLAKEVFSDIQIAKHFDSRAWVKVGRKCQLKEIPRRILAQLNPDDQMLGRGEEDIALYLNEYLKGKRFLIVLDDVWDKYMAYRLRPSNRRGRNEMKNPFPDENNGSWILVTARLMQVDVDGQQLSREDSMMQLLSEEESWDLLRNKVFGEKPCPVRLEKAGKKIAKKCDGLPLMIITVADLLTKEEDKTPEYWSEIATTRNHQLFMAAYDKISKVLLPSYRYLPGLLKTCFLYLGVFPQNYEIPRTKLINMWNADGFLERNSNSFSYPEAMECLGELVLNSLVMIYQITLEISWSVGQTQIKACGLHSSLWHMSNKEAKKTKFSYVLNSYNDGLEQDIQNQHRLCFHNNVLFGIKELRDLVEDNCAPTARSLLCYGPYIQYQVPVSFGLKLLTEFDALTLRFYEFPEEVLELVQLRYLALTFNGILPDSICRLSELMFLIVGRHLSIKSSRNHPSYLPDEIWNMEKLQHIQVMGSDLPDPCGSSLESLSTLSNVTVNSCTESVLKAIPNLRKLGIRIELAPNDSKPVSCFDDISHFVYLNSLKCVVVNPDIVPPVAPFSILPVYLTKLSLSGLGYPWEEMSKIGCLSHLCVLKLRNYACRGPVWEVEEKGFPSLCSLLIEDTDLIEWRIGHESFKCLGSLSIRNCYKLRRIHGDVNMSLDKIEFVDCDPLGVKQMEKAIYTHTLGQVEVGVQSSWNQTKRNTRIANHFVPKINYLDGDWSIG